MSTKKIILTKGLSILPCIVFISMLTGCSGNTWPANPVPAGDITPIRADSSNGAQRGLLGYYSGYANIAEGEFEIQPMREAAMHLNLVTILNGTAGVTAQVLWAESDPGQGLLKVRINIKHPYADNPYYTGFDVRGILITGASQAIGQGLWTAGADNPRLLNADGFTRWWNPKEFTSPGMFGYVNGDLGSPTPQLFDAQLNGFKIFASGYPSELDDDPMYLSVLPVDSPTGRAVFNAQSITRRYELKFPPGTSYFNYAVDASWAPPSANPPVVPIDFPPQANSQEAWWVKVDIAQNTLKYYPATGQHDGNLLVYVSVYDWQGKINGAIAPEVIMVKLHSSDLMGTTSAQAMLLNDDGNSAIYQADLTSKVDPNSAGTFKMGAEVISSGNTYKQSWQAAPNTAVAAYQIFDVAVAEAQPPPEFLKKFGVHAYVLRTSGGMSPAISDAEIAEDIAWANSFWNQYGFAFELVEKTFINNSNYYNLDPYDAEAMHASTHDTTGLINLYYVKSIVGMGGAFAMIECKYQNTTAEDSYIVFDASNNVGWEEVLAHESGHVIGMLEDLYWLYYYYTCQDVDYSYCGYSPTDIYCKSSDALDHNLMYFTNDTPNTPPSWYNISSNDIDMNTAPINSQGENAAYFHTHYPGNFLDMQ